MSAEIRALTRRIEQLQAVVDSIPSNPSSASSFASSGKVNELELKVVDLENKYNATKKFLEEALEKLGLLEKKLLDVESSQGCMCMKLDQVEKKLSSASSDDGDATVSSPAPVTDVSVAENPVFEEEVEEEEKNVSVEEAPDADEE